MFLRIWLFEREILAVHCSSAEPTIRIERGEDVDDLDQEIDELESEADRPLLAWSSSDPDDQSHLILRPEAPDG